MQENTPKNNKKIREKIFAKHAKPHGASLLVFRIIDILSNTDDYLTILQLQKKIYATYGYFYSHPFVMFIINNMHMYCSTIVLDVKRLPARRNKAFAFKISNNNNDKYSKTDGHDARRNVGAE